MCPLCGNAAVGRPVYRFHTKSMSLPFPPPEGCEFLLVVRCRGCGLAYLYPRPAETIMSSLYSNSTYYAAQSPGGYEDYFEQEISLRRTFRRFLIALCRRGLTGGALADIGCGHGYLLDMAQPFFDKRMGTDMCPEVAERGSALCDGVVCGGLCDLAKIGERFDLVTSVGVVEHVYEPVRFLKDCSGLIKKGGAVVLVTPDMDGFWRRCMGRLWPCLKLPEHIAFYDKKTLSILGSKAGMELVEVFHYHQAFPIGLIIDKLGFRLLDKGRRMNQSFFLPGVMIAAVFKGG